MKGWKRKINKKRSIIIMVIVTVVVIGSLVYSMCCDLDKINSKGDNKDNTTDAYQETKKQEEIKLIEKDAQKIYDGIPKIYEEVIEPFNDEFKLKTAMQYIASKNINSSDFSEENVNEVVKDIFGIEATLNKENLKEDKDEYSLYYYSETEGKYVIRAFGMEFIYNEQILKEVTENDKAYYVYVYNIVGEYIPDDSKNKLYLVIGDKEGKDIVEEYEADEFDTNAMEIVTKYKEELPIYRYTLTKSKTDKSYYLTEVEQMNY